MSDTAQFSSPLVSIALATYNGSRFLQTQLDSIYAQTWQNIEVVVCDDHSTDDTVSILEAYRLSHGLRYRVNQHNLGFLRNFEQVLSCCRGEFIALADQDDVWLPNKLTRLLSEIGAADLVYSDAALIDEDGRESPETLIQTSGVRPVDGRQFSYFVCNTCVTGCTVLLRRRLLEYALPIPDCETYHDWWLAVVASCHAGVRYVPERLVRYRQHSGNDTGAKVKTGLLVRLLAHIRGVSGEEKKRYYTLLKRRAHCYQMLQSRLIITADELAFLRDLGRYADGLLGPRFCLAPFIIAARYRRVLFPAAGHFERLIFVCSKLVVNIFHPR